MSIVPQSVSMNRFFGEDTVAWYEDHDKYCRLEVPPSQCCPHGFYLIFLIFEVHITWKVN